jgi:glycosyltransferase involved in cell wall biosynthesis
MRPLKIALIARQYWEESHPLNEDEGGAIRQLAEAVAALGHEVVVLTQSPEVRKLKTAPVGALETWVSPREKHRSLLTALRDRGAKRTFAHPKVHSDALALREFLSRRGPFDVLWAHAESPDGVVAAVAARKGGKLPPLLLQVQALRHRMPKGNPIFTEKAPLGLAFRQATRILAASEMIATDLLHYAGPGLGADALRAKVHVVPPNIQRAFLRAAREGDAFAGPMPDRVLYLGALSVHKGALLFLRAAPKTQASQRISTFVLVGGFVEYNRRFIQRWERACEAARVLLAGARVEYLGHVSSFEVIRQMKLARVVVLPALYEGFSRGVVEALLLGRPVITTDHMGASELVRAHQCGIVVPPHDSDALARAIDAVLSPIVPFSDNAQRAGRALIHDFSPEAIALQISRHLSEIALPPT